jgi:CheY-like chemotaxis protein
MVVDDNEDLVAVLRRYLEGSGYEVLAAYDGPQALEMIPAEKPDIVILDVYMPGMNGKDVLERLKADPATAKIPVIMQTAASEPQDFEDTAIGGADAHLPKPCDPPDLLLMIEALLKAAAAEEDYAG